MIRHLAQEGKTILISSHILSELAEMCDCVGILAEGRLVATGTVDEVQNACAAHTEIRVRCLCDGAALAAWFAQREPAQDVSCEGELVRFRCQGSREQQVELLREAILAGFRIHEFTAQRRSLEDVFLQITRTSG